MLIQTGRPRWGLTRRSALRGGLSTLIGLPFLEAMAATPARAQTSTEAPRRFIVFYMPNGMWMPSWTPATAGPLGDALPPLLAPLAAVKDEITVVSGLHNRAVDRGDAPPGPHARGTASFLTGARITASEDAIHNGVSADQLVADHLAGAGFRGLPSLELGCEGGGARGTCDAGYSCAYQVNIAWAGAEAPMPKETNPRALFDRLFSGVDTRPAEVRARERAQKRSVLDAVKDDAARLLARLGARDRVKVEEHLSGIRALERRLDDVDAPVCDAGPAVDDVDVNAPVDVTAYVRSMLDLMVMAVRCDRSRVMTFMIGNGGSPRAYNFIGVDGQHHGISHRTARSAELEQIDLWEMQQLAYLLERLREVDDGDGSGALDNSFVYAASELSDGNVHSPDDLPVIVAGRAGGLVGAGGRHVVVEPQPVANLLLTALQSTGMTTTRFANSTGPLDLG
jgi:hypothetical protein